MSRETIEQKAHRLHAAHRVNLLAQRTTQARVGFVYGDSGRYLVTVTVFGDFSCTCQTPNDRPCSHLAAVLLAVEDKRFTRAISLAHQSAEGEA